MKIDLDRADIALALIGWSMCITGCLIILAIGIKFTLWIFS